MSDTAGARSDQPNYPDLPDVVDSHPPSAQTPLGLDYFAPHAPDRRASRAANFALGVVIVSILPFICGLLNVAVAAGSYSPTITGSHRGGATLFLTAGVVGCALGLVRLAVLRHWTGVVFAGFLLAGQVAVVGCIGLAAV